MFYHVGFVSWISARSTGLKFPIWTDNKIRPGNRASPVTGLIWRGPKTRLEKTRGAYHLAKKSGNFGLNSNGKVTFRKFRSEIVEYLQRYSSFSVRNGTAEISLPFAKVSSFQSLISRKQLREIELQIVSAISFGWFAEFGKTLPLFNARPNRFILTIGKHPR